MFKLTEMPSFDEDEGGVLADIEETEEELDIEINDDEPSFLMGQTAQTVCVCSVFVISVCVPCS